ncbi:Na+/H+ antiporter subunit A [uncultured Nocardioides sp.]|uniref:Na+/H+ antiporter subunit A n=1 Tax=uncultured Nocardioides sp. TaxID=198441 RepID=UPI0026078F67|nr:Na+/H+ antiporter subunit A [uncultured Nocardioides sp.]
MLAFVLAHLVAAAAAPVLVRRVGRWTFAVLAIVPAVTFAWALTAAPIVLSGGAVSTTVDWVPAIDMELALSMGLLQWVMVLVVAGIGALVLAYCSWYFHTGEDGLVAFSTAFMGFVGAMLGLVLADDLLLLYVFWELTTVFSYLLIGFDPLKRANRLAAMEALIVTTLGGLTMLVGMLLLGREAGTLRISEILADPPPESATLVVAVLLILVGALSKSALVPFQFWLPGAMAAPTPVSAYLHAASMVKAGVYLVALLAPVFATVPGWHLVILTLGTVTMLLGGWRALRQVDVKLLLAYGTVSQLGFLMVLFGIGTRTAALAGLAMLVAHALFKATLFLSVGIIDHQTGTRDLRELSGVGRAMPVVAVAATIAGASMAGVPPLLGFVGKETVWAAVLELTEGEVAGVPPYAGWLVLAGLMVGSAFTAGYTLRFLWGAFWTKRGLEPTPVTPVPPPFAAAPVLLAALTVVLGFSGYALTDAFGLYADALPGPAEEYLALWHGLELPLLLSALTLAGGAALFAARATVCRAGGLVSDRLSAEGAYRFLMRLLDRAAIETTGAFQRGSVSGYLAVILVVVLVLPGGATILALGAAGGVDVVMWDRPAQVILAAVLVLAAVVAARSRRRLRAVTLAGVTGYGTALLFLIHGAPDIALTQVLVETVSLVVFVLVLRRLPPFFSDRPLSRSRYWRMALGAGVGIAVAGFLLVAANARSSTPISQAFAEAAYEYGYGRNVVNITLVDIRAWDTLGEIAVLVAAATGVASLIFLDSRTSGIRRVRDIPYPTDVQKLPSSGGRRVWLPGPRTLSPDRRSIIFEVVTRLVFHTIMVFSVYLLIAGHNLPGGGFAGGIVAGLALMVRYLAGGRYELDEAAPVDAGVLIGTGLFIGALASLGPLLLGGEVQRTYDTYLTVPLLGELHLVSSVVFDVGVYLVVIGLVLDLLRTFGSRLDRHILREERGGDTDSERENRDRRAFR